MMKLILQYYRKNTKLKTSATSQLFQTKWCIQPTAANLNLVLQANGLLAGSWIYLKYSLAWREHSNPTTTISIYTKMQVKIAIQANKDDIRALIGTNWSGFILFSFCREIFICYLFIYVKLHIPGKSIYLKVSIYLLEVGMDRTQKYLF